MACFFYVELALELLKGKSFEEAVKAAISTFDLMFSDNTERIHFARILNGSLAQLSENDIYSSGYVIHSLEACLWCIYDSKSYKEAVLRAVNLGDDTDTTAAITGGLAGIVFGYESIPISWINTLARKEDIINLCKRFHSKVISK